MVAPLLEIQSENVSKEARGVGGPKFKLRHLLFPKLSA